MAARTFEDAAGIRWDVFEVHRATEAPRGVTPGLEKGWLTFVSAQGKRRLAPFPPSWETISQNELERLCAAARVANPPRYPMPGLAVGSDKDKATGKEAAPTTVVTPDELGESLVRDMVRVFAHEARANGMAAIEAMVRLKTLLIERYGGSDVSPEARADAADMRRVRRWFVEAYYFERPA